MDQPISEDVVKAVGTKILKRSASTSSTKPAVVQSVLNSTNRNLHQYHKVRLSSSPLLSITFAISQQCQTYLSTASIWFSHSFELLSLPMSAVQLALLPTQPAPLLNNKEYIEPVSPIRDSPFSRGELKQPS